MRKRILNATGAALAFLALAGAPAVARASASAGQYAKVNGVDMYFEVHGEGEPILLIHGGLCTIAECFASLIDGLKSSRRVIAVEFQGHGHTADIDRPLRSHLLADDMSKLLKQLGVAKADVLGFSVGAAVAYELAKAHPEQVRKLVTLSLLTSRDGAYSEFFSNMANLTPDMFKGSSWLDAYLKANPDPQAFGRTVAKLKDWTAAIKDEPDANLAALPMPVMLVAADADMIKPEHSVEQFRLVGGGVFGDVVKRSPDRLAIIPGATHATLLVHSKMIAAMVADFLDESKAKD